MRFDIMKRMISFLLAMILLFSCVPVNAFAAGTESTQEPETTPSFMTGFEGKTVSVLGDSISTYTGVSNNTGCNATIGSNAVYYTACRHDIYRADTWWQQVIDALGMELLVNNSWSGSMVVYPRQGEGSEGCKTRCVNLHNNEGREPDVILVFMGTNDFSYVNTDDFLGRYTLGTADAVDHEMLIVDNGDGTYTYATPATTCEAYAIMLHKMKNRYPNAEIYCMNLMQRRDPDYADSYADAGQPAEFNAELAKIIAKYECALVDLENCGIEADSSVFDLYIGDKRVHPNSLGMDLMSEAVISAMLGQDTDIYDVSFDLTNVTGDGAHAVLPGNPYTVTLAEAEGFRNMSVIVTMGGEDVTASCYADGIVTIESVTAVVVITAKSELDYDPQNYRWEFDGSDLTTVTADGNTENVLTKLAGSNTDGVFSTSSYSLEKIIVLSHDQPWSVEWKCEGTWKGTSTSGGRLFSTASSSSNDTRYIFKSVNSYLIAMGERTSSGSYNYGIALADHGIDGSERHIYRLENRVAEDGTNLVWLYVDGVEVGALNNLYMDTTDQNTTSDWLSGQDFLFPYIGTDTHGLNNCSIDYIQVWEGGSDHYHTYTAEVTEPTYNKGGYTTYTCTGCGESYVADYTDPIALHTYRWELVEDAFVPVTTDGAEENLLSLRNSSITDGAFTNVLYNIDTSIHLYHDRPWVIEWKSSGDNARTAGGTSGGSGLLSSNTVLQSDEGTWFLYKRPSNYLIALCYRDADTSIQSGIALADHGIDGSELHTYRLENRVAEDGSNMVYLIVDGMELGAMNNLFVSAVDQGETTDFLNGLDWTFDYMGITNYYLNSCSIEYMQIWEGGEPADFEGKTISILGDSISTYTGVSDDASVNATLCGGAIYYTPGRWDIYREDTWWQQTIDALGMELLVNNSWSGSCVLHTRRGTVGAYVDRCVQLHNDKTGEEPDVIVTFIAANDFSYYQDTLGTAAIAYDTLIV